MRKSLVTVIAVKSESKIPTAKVIAKPRIIPAPLTANTKQISKPEKLESLIELQALIKPSDTATVRDFPLDISSFIRSKIKIFASTAMPSEKTMPAIPAKVRVTGISLNKATKTTPYINKAMLAISPEIL